MSWLSRLFSWWKPQPPAPAPAPAPLPVPSPGPPNLDIAEALLRRHNHERQAAGVEPLRLDTRLTMAAASYAVLMAKKSKLSHSLGDDLFVRLRAVGYSARSVGENIAAGQTTPDEAVGDWLKSKGHRRNMLNADYLDVGFGRAKSKHGTWYWCAIFGRLLASP